MRKVKKIVFVFIAFILGISFVNAECDFTETSKLNSLAVNVKANIEQSTIEDKSYTPLDGATQEEIDNFTVNLVVFNINIINITKELYITVEDDNKDIKTYNYSDTNNGKITIVQKDLTRIHNYKITIYSSSETNCPDTKLYTIPLETPYYNRLSEYDICTGIEEFYLCHEFLNVKSVDFEEFERLANSYRAKKIDKNGKKTEQEKKEDNSIINFIKNHKILVVILSIVIIIVIVILVILIAKKIRGKKYENI